METETKKIIKAIENASLLLKENNELKKELESIKSNYKFLVKEQRFILEKIAEPDYVLAIQFEKEPLKFIEEDIEIIINNKYIIRWFFYDIKDQLKWTNCKTLKDYFNQSDKEFLRYKNFGKIKLRKLRMLQVMVNNNTLVRFII